MVGKKSEERAEREGSTDQRTKNKTRRGEKEITDKNILRLRTEERCQIVWFDKEA